MTSTYSAWAGFRHLASGPLAEVLPAAWPHLPGPDPVLFFDLATGRQTDFDTRGTAAEALARLETPAPKAGPGRPKLGVVSAEVTLLPRHWDWLNAQPAKASATLRRLVEEAMAREASDPKRRLEALGRILWALAGNEANFEEASRALYAGDRGRLEALASAWPGDLPALVRDWS